MDLNTALLFDGLYVITNDGKLYSNRRNKFLKPATDKYGYLCHTISINGKRSTHKAHRLVATSFIQNEENKPTVDHINGIRTDNRAENLRWATHREQQFNPTTIIKTKAIHDQTDYKEMGRKRDFGRKPTAVYKNGEFIEICKTLRIAAQKYNANYSKASECANGKRKKAGGMVFCFV